MWASVYVLPLFYLDISVKVDGLTLLERDDSLLKRSYLATNESTLRIASLTLTAIVHGGGRVFGPTPRDYSFKLNKKVKGLARRSALTYKAQKQEIIVVENFELAAPKTKDFVALSQALQVADAKALFVVEALSDNLVLSSRNLRKARVMNAFQLNTYAVLDCKKIVLSEAAVAVINEQFKA